MIQIKLNDDNFEYDIYSLVKAFYPTEEIKFVHEEPKEEVSYFYVIEYEKTSIRLVIYGSNSKIFDLTVNVNAADRKDTKNRLKRLIYDALSDITGKHLSWGTLNGIRPTKIPLRLIEEGKSRAEIIEYMQDTYYISDYKANECIDIALKEHKILSKISYEEGYSLYIGIPFCPTKCLYCSFTSYPIKVWDKYVEDYLDALEKELVFVNQELSDRKLDSIYIGGGTPTSINAEQLERLLSMIDKYIKTDSVLEYTIEAGRPDSITRDKLLVIKSHPITRISINPQSMNQETLDVIGRRHSVEDIKQCFAMAREIGFDNINMDIILGLPGENEEMVRHTLSEIAKLNPDNLTVHSLALKRAARLNEEFDKYSRMGLMNSDELMDFAISYAKEMGMEPYYLYRQKNMAGNQENIGFAKPGKEGVYNILIMEEKQTILALGAGAASKYVTDDGKNVTRSENVKDPKVYIDRIDEMIERKRVAINAE